MVIGERIDAEAFISCWGIDNNLCQWKKEQQGDFVLAGYVYEPVRGRKMEVLTTKPGMQLIRLTRWKNKPAKKEKPTTVRMPFVWKRKDTRIRQTWHISQVCFCGRVRNTTNGAFISFR